MSERIPIVLIGAGSRGRLWIKALLQEGSFEIAGIVDPAETARDAIAREFPELRAPWFDSTEEAVRHVDARASIVAALETQRKEQCLASCGAGWHVLSEKPFCHSLDEARAVVAAAERAGLMVAVTQNFRYMPAIDAMHGMVAAGEIGEPGGAGFYRARWHPYEGYLRRGRRTPDHPHGYLYQMGVHDLDLIRYTLGLNPVRVAAISYRPPWSGYPGATTVTAVIEFERNVRVSYHGAWGSSISDHFWRIDGTNGSVKVSGTDRSGHTAEGLYRASFDDEEWTQVPVSVQGLPGDVPLSHSDRRILSEFANAIRTGTEMSTTGRENLLNLILMEAIVRSSEGGGTMVDLVSLARPGELAAV